MPIYYPSVNALGVSTQGNTGGNTGTSNGTWVAVGSNNITISQSTGTNNVHSLFFSGPSPGGGAAFSGGASNIGNTSGNTGTVSNQLVFAGGNNITLSQSTNAGGATLTVSAFNQSNQQMSLYAVSNTTQSTSGTVNASNLSFHGAGIASVGVSNGSVVVSVPAGGGGGDGVNILAAGTQTANTTGTVVFSNSNRVSFGMSNSSVVTASVEAPALTWHIPWQGSLALNNLGNNTALIWPVNLPQMTGDRINLYPLISNSSNSTGTVSATWRFGLYTRSAGSLLSASTGSLTNAITYSGTLSNSTYAGLRVMSLPINFSASEGHYWAFFISSTGQGGNNCSYSHLCLSQLNSNFSGSFGVSSTSTNQMYVGFGRYSTTTSGFPETIQFSEIRNAGSAQWRSQPYIVFASSTV